MRRRSFHGGVPGYVIYFYLDHKRYAKLNKEKAKIICCKNELFPVSERCFNVPIKVYSMTQMLRYKRRCVCLPGSREHDSYVRNPIESLRVLYVRHGTRLA